MCILDLFASQNEGALALDEVVAVLPTPFRLRMLFIHLLVNDCVASPRAIWDTHIVQGGRYFH